MTALTSSVSKRRPCSYSGLPSIICSQATIPLVPSKSVERNNFIVGMVLSKGHFRNGFSQLLGLLYRRGIICPQSPDRLGGGGMLQLAGRTLNSKDFHVQVKAFVGQLMYPQQIRHGGHRPIIQSIIALYNRQQ